MKVSPKLRGMLAGATLAAMALGTMSLAVPAQAGQWGVYDQDRNTPRRLNIPLSLRDGHPRYDIYAKDQERWPNEDPQRRLWGPQDQDTMRDGGPAPWDGTRWGLTR